MKRLAVAMFAVCVSACSKEPTPPIASGVYQFQHKFAEHPSMPSIEVKVIVESRRIKIVNEQATDVFPGGILADGEILWHAGSKQWIIGKNESDKDAAEVGGCSDGPEVIDLANKIYWTC